MPRVVVRKSYRCQPGKRREVLAALQKMDAAGAEAGYPRGRYVYVETRAPGEPDLEVEFTFESYADLERLERAMRERLARYLREGGATGQEHLLEPSATKHLLLLETTPGSGGGAASAARSERGFGGAAPAGPGEARQESARGSGGAQRPPATAEPLDLTIDGDKDDPDLEEPPEPDVPPPPEIPAGMTRDQFQQDQLRRARAALQDAEKTVGATKQSSRRSDRT
jgi:hypothetical protein